MKNFRYLPIAVCLFAFFCLSVPVFGQANEDKDSFASLAPNGSGVRWSIQAPHAESTLTIAAPDGQVFTKTFNSGSAPVFSLTDEQGAALPDGQYTYELRLAPVLSNAVKRQMRDARAKGNDAAVERELRKRNLIPSRPMVQSGTFSVINGSVVLPGAVEEPGLSAMPAPERKSLPHSAVRVSARPMKDGEILPIRTIMTAGMRMSRAALRDQVIPDDLIVQGSACVGIDCVNGEVFGFDTIRMKENNTRLQFDDTSVTAGFPTTNWQIRANSSASGGGDFLAFVDQGNSGNSETGTIVFQVDAGVPANSLRVGTFGRVGLRTATPVLDLHVVTGNTPAFRLDQNASSGFTPQVWDIAGNEVNFFIRDVTNASTLPFRISPGSPTSSVHITSGGVGINTSTPRQRFEVRATQALLPATSGTTQGGIARMSQTVGPVVMDFGIGGDLGFGWIQAADGNNLANNHGLLLNPNGGNVGINTTAPTDALSVNGNASKPGGGSWSNFSDARLKNIRGSFNRGLSAVMQMEPLRYEYKSDNALKLKSNGEHIGFSAQEIQKIIPEAVTKTGDGFLLVNNDPILWTMLNAIKEQQKEIEELKAQIEELKAQPAKTNRQRRSTSRRR